MSNETKDVDPYVKISELEKDLAQALARVKELEDLLSGMKSASSAKDVPAEMAKLVEENVKLKAELSRISSQGKKHEKILFSMTRSNATKKGFGAYTLKRNQLRSDEAWILTEEVVRWLNPILNLSMTKENLLDTLSSGVLLCKLIIRIDPKLSMPKIHENAISGSFFAHDNVKNFLKACVSLGVSQHVLFESGALVSAEKNQRAVVHCILALAKVATKYGIAPPEIVKMEMELDELKKSGHGVDAKEKSTTSATPDEIAADSVIHAKVEEVCHELGLNTPDKIKMGVYKFDSNTTAFVRVLRDTALVRWKDAWEELGSFMMQLDASKKDDSKDKDKEKEKKEKEAKDEKDRQEKEKIKTEEEKKLAKKRQIALEDAEEEEREKKRREADINAKKEFFYLTALAVKMNHELQEDAQVIPTQELYEKAIQQDIPFNQYAEWIQKELTKSYLVSEHGERVRGQSIGDLRERRRKTVTSLQKRKEAHESHVPTSLPE